MTPDGLLADEHLIGNLLIRRAASGPDQNLDLTLRQATVRRLIGAPRGFHTELGVDAVRGSRVRCRKVAVPQRSMRNCQQFVDLSRFMAALLRSVVTQRRLQRSERRAVIASLD